MPMMVHLERTFAKTEQHRTGGVPIQWTLEGRAFVIQDRDKLRTGSPRTSRHAAAKSLWECGTPSTGKSQCITKNAEMHPVCLVQREAFMLQVETFCFQVMTVIAFVVNMWWWLFDCTATLFFAWIWAKIILQYILYCTYVNALLSNACDTSQTGIYAFFQHEKDRIKCNKYYRHHLLLWNQTTRTSWDTESGSARHFFQRKPALEDSCHILVYFHL